MKKLLNRIKLDSWVERNKEPVWRGEVYIGGDTTSASAQRRAEQYKEWSISHAEWTRKLLKYLNVPSEY